MAEFYKYAERTADSQIDWAKIGSDMTTMLKMEATDREKRKADLEKATQESLNTLANVKVGKDVEWNNWTLNTSNDLTQGLLLNNKLLKSGKLSPKDYMIYVANTKSGTDQVFKLQDLYQKQFDIRQERMNSADPTKRSQAIEYTSSAYIEEFGNLSESKVIQDPRTGIVSVGIMKPGKDGVPVLTNKTMSANDLYRAVQQQYNYFDTQAASGGIAKVMAPVVRDIIKEGSLSAKGQIITTDDALQNPSTVKALDNSVSSFLTNPLNISSILSEDIGLYHPVYSKEALEKDPKHNFLVEINKSGTFAPTFSKEQEAAAKDYLLNLTKAQIKSSVSIKQFESSAVTQAELNMRQKALDLQREEFEHRKKQDAKKETGSSVKEDLTNKFAEYVEATMPPIESSTGLQEEKGVANIKNALSLLGYTFGEADMGDNAISIKNNTTGRTTEIRFDMNNQRGARKAIVDYIIQDKISQSDDKGIPTGLIEIEGLYDSGAFDRVSGTKTKQGTTSQWNN